MSDRRMVKTKTSGVYRRDPHGTFMATWTDVDGKRRTKTCATYDEAKEAKRAAEEAKRRGERRAPDTRSVAAYLDAWIETYTGRTNAGISPLVLAEYRRDLETVKAKVGRIKLAAFGPEDGRRLVRALLRDSSPATVRRILTPFRAALADAVDDRKLTTNPMQGVRVPRPRLADEEDEADRALTDEQVAAIIDNAPERYRLLIRVIAMTGVRRSEALALQWRDIEDGAIHVRRRLRKGQIGPPQSKAGRRTIPIPTALVDDLALARATALHPDDDDFVSATASGKPLGEDNAHHRAMVPAAKAAGVPLARFHDLRRAAISQWIHGGVSPKVVQEIAGHHDAALTLQVDAKVRGGDMPAGDALGLAPLDARDLGPHGA